MKLTINPGAYGWQHRHWPGRFYPDDLPEDWQLSYYSNEFNAVLVPVTYWQNNAQSDCVQWLDNVHDEFRFFIECSANMFEHVSVQALQDCLRVLRPQLSALVFLDSDRQMTEPLKQQFVDMVKALNIEVYDSGESFASYALMQVKKIWREADEVGSDFALLENDLKDLRAARKIVERFVTSLKSENPDQEVATIIVKHANLQPDDLSKFRAVLEIMGY